MEIWITEVLHCKRKQVLQPRDNHDRVYEGSPLYQNCFRGSLWLICQRDYTKSPSSNGGQLRKGISFVLNLFSYFKGRLRKCLSVSQKNVKIVMGTIMYIFYFNHNPFLKKRKYHLRSILFQQISWLLLDYLQIINRPTNPSQKLCLQQNYYECVLNSINPGWCMIWIYIFYGLRTPISFPLFGEEV